MTPMLLEAGHQVVGFDSGLFAGSAFQSGIESVPSIDKDIRDVTPADCEGFDAVIHLAGLSNDPLGDLNPALTDEINHRASARFARAAKTAGVKRFLFSSSCSNYGAGGDAILNEESAFNPVTPYGHSKVAAELAIRQLADSGFSPTFLRSATAYGVSPLLRFDLVLNNLVAWACAAGRVLIKSDGTPWRPIVHIEDISQAFICALEAPLDVIHNEAFNVGSTEENYRIRELADIVKATVPGCEIEYAADAGPDKRCYRVDCGKIARSLKGFRPRWTARKGARQLYDTFAAQGVTVADFEGPKYKRIAHLKRLLDEGTLDASLRWTAGFPVNTNAATAVAAE
jgi:nucleoside-diphosphate-sugar epimerase